MPETIPHGTPWKHANLEMVTGRREILPGISVVSNVSQGENVRETPELSLVINTPRGQVVLVGCSHPGIDQILTSVAAKSSRVRMVVGGPGNILRAPKRTGGAGSHLLNRADCQTIHGAAAGSVEGGVLK